MIEITMLHYLESRLQDVPVRMEEPVDPPARYVVLRKTGSDATNRIREATIAAMSYGGTLYDAAALNEQVVEAVTAMTPADGVFAALLNSDYEYTNTETKQYRYQAVFEVYY